LEKRLFWVSDAPFPGPTFALALPSITKNENICRDAHFFLKYLDNLDLRIVELLIAHVK
jgi:hypothetical protein